MEGDPLNFRPPVLVGERVVWLGSGSGVPQPSTVRWIGRIPEITAGWTVGIELDRAMPVGGIDGTWRKRKLFACEPKRGLLVPIDIIMKESNLLKTRHSLAERYYEEGTKPISQQSDALLRKLSLPQSATTQEFLARVLPPTDRRPQPQINPPEVGLSFKTAVNQIKNVKPGNQAENDAKSASPVLPANTAPLTVANVRNLGRLNRLPSDSREQTVRERTLGELEKFKKHLDELERLKHGGHSLKSRRRKVGKNPESLYDLAKPAPELEESLILRIIGERKEPSSEVPKRKHTHREDSERKQSDSSDRIKSPKEKRRETVQTVIPEEQPERDPSESKTRAPLVSPETSRHGKRSELIEPLEKGGHCVRSGGNNESSAAQATDTRKEEFANEQKSITSAEPKDPRPKDASDKAKTDTALALPVELSRPKKEFRIENAVTLLLPQLETPPTLEVNCAESSLAEEKFEEEACTESVVAAAVEVFDAVVFEEPESVSQPTPTIRKRRQQDSTLPPVPAPRRRSGDGQHAPPAEEDTASVLYEPAFLTAYLADEARDAMSDVRGTFRRIDEDELDRRPPTRRLLAASVSAPGGSRKGLFSFLRWFRKSKPQDDLDLDAFDAPSVASSPLFTRSRLANAESVDTLYSIATVSSFAFVSGAQYQSRLGSDRRKKRRAPPPPTPPQRRDVSLPSTLEGRAHQQHRRSASESYKDRRSGAFAHVHGKRKAPAPPAPPPRDRLYPSLTSVRDNSLTKKKRPAPRPPESTAPSEEIRVVAVVEVSDQNNRVAENISDDPPRPDPVSSTVPAPARDDNIVCNDTLRLERGVLKPNKVMIPSAIPPDVAKVVPTSPVSPRPWYKRKSLEKRKEKISDDWMPEVGIARPPVSPEFNPLKFNFFSRGEDKKKEEKRKSGLSLLANISELDREAAEICRKEQAHQQQMLADDDAKFYADAVDKERGVLEPDIPKRNSARELISLFNSIGAVTKINHSPSLLIREDSDIQPICVRDSEREPALNVCSKPVIKTAAVVGTKEFVSEEAKAVEPVAGDEEASKAQTLYDLRAKQPSPTISTIAEISEPSSSAATLNQYAEAVWTCTRCTLENLQWKNRCDACSSCKPSFNPGKNQSALDKRKSEMEFEIDWERELQKYFPVKKSPSKEEQVSAKLTLSKTGDVLIKTETNQGNDLRESNDFKVGDLDELRKKRLAFFIKSLGNEAMTSLRDAAAKKSLDETEKSKLKGMLKEMKNSLPKYEAVINKAGTRNLNAADSGRESSDSTVNKKDSNADSLKENDDGAKYGAIRKVRREDSKPAEALLITTTTVLEDIIVRKKNPSVNSDAKKEPAVLVPVHNFSTVGLKNGEPYTSLKKARRVGDGPFELMRARDLANIIESKTGVAYPAHVYANYPIPKVSDASSESNGSDLSTGREVARLATQLTRASGVAEFKAALDPAAADTLAVNRLLRRLEAAIAAGRHDQAATLARELAGLKVSCSVTRQRPSPSPSPTAITVEMYVEDKVSHQGPIPVRVHRTMTLADLKMKVQADFQIPGHVQRWILGKQLATEDFRTLEDLGVTVDRCAIFLYLVAPEPEPDLIDIAPSAPQKEEVSSESASGAAAPPLGKGWYYNYEEDRYSYCESDSDVSPDRDTPETSKTAAVRVIQRTIESARAKSKSSSPPVSNGVIDKKQESEESVLQPAAQAKPYSPKPQRPPLKSSISLPEQATEKPNEPTQPKITNHKATSSTALRDENGSGESKQQNGGVDPPGDKSKSVEKDEAAAAARPRSRSIFDLIKPQSNDTLKKDLKVISVNAVKETIEKLTRRGEDLQRNGWKCSVCTLVNAATRPGCAACTAPRPPGYADPVSSPAEDELRRLRRDQSLDLPLMGPEPPLNENQHYRQLVNLDNADLVINTEQLECPVCLMELAPGDGVVLRECLHTFCRACLVQTVEFSEEAEVKCPFRDANYACESVLQQREIKALVPRRVFEQHLARSVAQAENRMGNAFHCKTPDCQGWCVLEDNVNEFRCPVCSHVNCLTCQAIHEGFNCRAYQDRLHSSSDTNAEAKRTRSMLEDMVQRGDAMACPTCQVVLMKKWGCDWLRCSMCKTEICWVTRGPRWGPAGKGDTSAGCQCGVNGVKCHPKCNYCH